jgi:hypothetical protein
MLKRLCPHCREPFEFQLIPELGTNTHPAFVPESRLEPGRLRHDCGAFLEVSIYNDNGARGIMVVEFRPGRVRVLPPRMAST